MGLSMAHWRFLLSILGFRVGWGERVLSLLASKLRRQYGRGGPSELRTKRPQVEEPNYLLMLDPNILSEFYYPMVCIW